MLLTLKVDIDVVTGEVKDTISQEANIMLRRDGFLKPYQSLTSASEAMKDQRVLDYIQAKINELNEKHVVSRASKIRKWIILPGDFSLKGGHLTPTMKLRRKVVSNLYKTQIESLYQEPKL